MAADGLPMTWLFEEEGKTNRFGARGEIRTVGKVG
jgi:hypothetical protein